MLSKYSQRNDSSAIWNPVAFALSFPSLGSSFLSFSGPLQMMPEWLTLRHVDALVVKTGTEKRTAWGLSRMNASPTWCEAKSGIMLKSRRSSSREVICGESLTPGICWLEIALNEMELKASIKTRYHYPVAMFPTQITSGLRPTIPDSHFREQQLSNSSENCLCLI